MSFSEWKEVLAVLADDYHTGQFSPGYKLSSWIRFSYSSAEAESIRQGCAYQMAEEKFKGRF